jgi:hypothetical protein
MTNIFRIGSKTRIEIPIDDMSLRGLSVRLCNETKQIIIEGQSNDAISNRSSVFEKVLE